VKVYNTLPCSSYGRSIQDGCDVLTLSKHIDIEAHEIPTGTQG